MNETQRNIKAYEEALPHLRERVTAVALLLVMSICMMTSATFAWLTISRSPEVTGVNTTVAANGNLEIALVNPEGTVPAESQVGDSMAVAGKSVTAANLTWGNLINLSDESYGLENLTLRPAKLNTAALATSPMYGAVYGQDGRVSQLTSHFDYTSWVPPEGEIPGYFGISDAYGVRAISSTIVEAVGAEAVYVKMVDDAISKNGNAQSLYLALANNKENMQSLATMMGLYMTVRMDADGTYANPTCKIADLENLRDMYAQFLQAFDAEAEALAALANLQLFLQYGSGGYDAYSGSDMYNTSTAALAAKGIQISDLSTFIKDRNTVASDLEKLEEICLPGVDVTWVDSGLNKIVNNLVDVGKCTIGQGSSAVTINSIIAEGVSGALGYLSGKHQANITNGILYNFELRTGAYIEVENLDISVSVKRYGLSATQSVTASVIRTTADEAGYTWFATDEAHAESMNNGEYAGGVARAADTYGLAIDLWVRTNATNSYLTLEGNVITETNAEQATGKDATGNIVDLYTVTITGEDEEGNSTSYSLDLYQGTDTEGNEVWYNATSHTVVTEDELGGKTPVNKMVDVETVIGYEGENRVWQENDKLSADATTQGSGSCYVYYADTPEDQAQSLKLLSAMKVAFVGYKENEAYLMTTAEMDTERCYAANGRVIVPLKLRPSSSIDLGEDEDGNTIYGITNLEKNTATRITAIVYLDGANLSNTEVLAAADIQGRLNVQFGSSADMNTLADEKLQASERKVSAAASVTSFDYDTATEPMTTTVSVTVDGEQPTTMKGFFMRAINSTQGSREGDMTFMDEDGDGTWTASYTFDSPGTYTLRTVTLDGVDYALDDYPVVTVSGFTVTRLYCTEDTNSDNHVNIMTAAGSSSVDLTLQFASDDASKMPSTVQGRYLRSDGSATNVKFTYNPTSNLWTGTANFLTSGDYTLQYLVLDGDYTELDESLWQTASVYLGMRVEVKTTSPWQLIYRPSEMADNEKNLAMTVKILDNTGTEMPGLSDAKLTYTMKGSTVNKMDTDLTWNGSVYVGELAVSKPGIWQFSNVTVGSNILTTATLSPTFTILSPEPPAYYAAVTDAYQYAPSNNAEMGVQITNASAAQAQAYIINQATKEGTWVTGSMDNEFENAEGTSVAYWTFEVPKDANGYQEGNWTLTQLKLWDVFDEDGTAYTSEEPLEIDVADKNIKTKVVSRPYITFPAGRSQNFSGNNFLESYTVDASDDSKALYVDIVDFEGKAITGISNVQLTFAYVNGTSSDYGGYSSSDLNNATEGATVTVPLTANAAGTRFSQTADFNFLYAGDYETTFSFKVSGTTYTYSESATETAKMLPTHAPVYTVWSEKPEVKVTAVSKAPGTTFSVNSHSDANSGGGFTQMSGVSNSFTDYYATVYLEYTGAIAAWRYYAEPSVTLELSGIADGVDYSASMTFNHPTAAYAKKYTFTDEAPAMSNEIGHADEPSLTDANPALYPAGKQTVSALSIKHNNMDFAITLDNPVTINQPQYPPYVTFTINDSTFTGTAPSNVYSQDGETITLTLPKLDAWTEGKSSTIDGEFTQVSSSSEYYGYMRENVGSTFSPSYEYTPYTKTTTISQAVSSKTTWTVTREITGWKIGNTVYEPGETVTVTGDKTAVAVITATEGAKTTETTTATKTVIKYVAGSVTTTRPSGSRRYSIPDDSETITYS